jgi:hypothetical protein
MANRFSKKEELHALIIHMHIKRRQAKFKTAVIYINIYSSGHFLAPVQLHSYSVLTIRQQIFVFGIRYTQVETVCGGIFIHGKLLGLQVPQMLESDIRSIRILDQID